MKTHQYIATYAGPDGRDVAHASFHADTDDDAIGVALRRWPQEAASYELRRVNPSFVAGGTMPLGLDTFLAETTTERMAERLAPKPSDARMAS